MKAKIGIIILAAGAGSRFAASGGDSPKQLVSIDGVSMLQRAVNLANQLLPGAVHVVLGSESHTIKSQLYSCDINLFLLTEFYSVDKNSVPVVFKWHSL